MKEVWQDDVAARARAYWTAERTQKLTAGKKLPLLPAEAAPLLRALGLMNSDASIPADSAKKYLQINHLVALVEPAFVDLTRQFNLVRILDAGCGSSYLTFLVAWCFANRWKHPAEILGVDRNEAVIKKCAERAALAGLPETLRFAAAPLEGLDFAATWKTAFGTETDPGRPNAVLALHACDTATDHALALAITLKADFIGVAPCCQAELARKWGAMAGANQDGDFGPVWRSPHLRRELGATTTDALRTLLLRGCGYEVTPTEFVPSTHTPKNTLLRAHRRGAFLRDALAEYAALRRVTGGAGIALEELVPAEHRARLSEMPR